LILAVGGPLDLLSLNEAGIPLAFEVADSGVCLLSRTSELDLEWRCQTRLRFLDFKFYLDRQWSELGERLGDRRRDGAAVSPRGFRRVRASGPRLAILP
jgi:hypothetical protein